MDSLIVSLKRDFPAISFISGELPHWSPSKQQVTYTDNSPHNQWTLLHELGHALCGHKDYKSDVDLLQKETEAWSKAAFVGKNYGVAIAQEHIETCLDTYRDWLHKRSTCPECGTHGLQHSKALYYCPNCQTHWQVSSARFCRPYRLKKAQTTK